MVTLPAEMHERYTAVSIGWLPAPYHAHPHPVGNGVWQKRKYSYAPTKRYPSECGCNTAKSNVLPNPHQCVFLRPVIHVRRKHGGRALTDVRLVAWTSLWRVAALVKLCVRNNPKRHTQRLKPCSCI
jgi:hypothetical protein